MPIAHLTADRGETAVCGADPAKSFLTSFDAETCLAYYGLVLCTACQDAKP